MPAMGILKRRPYAVLVVLTAMVYANALGGSFHFDDSHAIEQNPAIRSLTNVPRFFVDPSQFSVLQQNQNYRPMLLVSYAATYAVARLRPAAFIFGNIVVHIACVLMVYAALLRVRRLLFHSSSDFDWVAFLGAAIFAVHPLGSECVNYVSARSESLCAAFTLVSLLCYLRARDGDGGPWLLLSACAIVGALLTKLVAAPFPLLLLAIELAANDRQSLRVVTRRLAPVSAAVLVGVALGMALTPRISVANAAAYPPLVYLRCELPVYFHYLRLFIWPAGQSADPSFPASGSFVEPRVLASGVVILCAAILSVYGLIRRRAAGVALAGVWYLLCLAPTSSLASLAELANEHRPYLANVSLCALAAALVINGARWLFRPQRADAVSAIAILAALAGMTVLRNAVWRDELSLWRDVAAKAPESARAKMNLGLALMNRRQMGEAGQYLADAVRLAPDYPYAHINYGNWLLANHQPNEGLAHLERAIALAPDNFYTHYYRGLAAESLAEDSAARVRYFARTVELAPTFPDGFYHLAVANDGAGDLGAAVRAAQDAVRLRGSDSDRDLLAFEIVRNANARR